MATGSSNMTTYKASQVIGNNTAQNPAGALLQSGAGRADNSTTGDTWIFLDTPGGTASPWGIKHAQGDNKIKIIGSGTDGFWVKMNTGVTYILGQVGIGYNPETSGNTYKLYVNGTTNITGDTSIGGNISLTTNGKNIVFATFSGSGTTGTSGGLVWSGSTDGASIYYTAAASDKGQLVINMTDDADARISLRTQGTERIGINSNGTYVNTQLQREGKSVSWYQGRNAAIIQTTTYSGYDAILSIKTTSGDWSQGVYTNNVMYWTYILDSNYNSNTNTTTAQMSLDASGNLLMNTGNIYFYGSDRGIYYKGTKAAHRMIRFIDNTSGTDGNGISIGGGGLAIFGSGESADTMVSQLGYTGGSETTVIASDGSIFFYPGQQSYDASAKLEMTASRFWAGVNSDTTREAQVGCQSGAGQIYLYSQAATSGTRGLYVTAHGTGGAVGIIESNTNNSITVRADDVWGGKVRVVDNWVGFYSATRTTTTRYGYIQANVDRMYFRKENSTANLSYYFDFNANVYTSGHFYGTSTASSWLEGQKNLTGGFNLTDATNTGSYWPWIRQTNTSSKKWFSLGVLNNSLYVVGSATTRTENGCDYTWRFDVSNGYLYGNFSGTLSGNSTGVLDVGNTSKVTTFAYSKAGLAYADYTWLAGWNGYELRAVAKSQFAQASHKHGAGDINSGTLGVARGGTGASSFTANSVIVSGSSTTAALTTRAIYTRSSVGTLDWGTYSTALVTNACLAYWNGCYSGTSSNLQYCDRGRFGTIVTKGTGDYLGASANATSATRINGNLAAITDANGHNIWVSSGSGGDGIPKIVSGCYVQPSTCTIVATKVKNAVWNDYAECRIAATEEPGRCVTETQQGKMVLTTTRLQAGCKLTSDTYGTLMGETEQAKTPIAVAGRVLVYPYRPREEYSLGAAVCSAPGGTVDIMTRDEIMMYPERIVGTVSEIPDYDVWNCGSKEAPTTIKVNGRIWIYVK